MSLSLNSIFSSLDFADEGFDRPRWCHNSSDYTTLRNVQGSLVREIILHHILERNNNNDNTDNNNTAADKTEEERVLVGISNLYPIGRKAPLIIDDYTLSNDLTKVLLFTDSQKVWRLNTKGAYWIISLHDSANPTPYQLGASFPNPKILMYATFSPCNTKVAYVYENNIYSEDLLTHQITQLTYDGNENIINGNFDWVYEEEFHLRNGFRWSPDSQHIAFWQLDQTHVPIVHLINNTSAKYPSLIPIHYPKTGDQNSKVRIGVISVTGGNPNWVPLPCDVEGYHGNSNSYIADMTYHQSTGNLIIQQINRLQNHLIVWCVDSTTWDMRIVFEDHDDAWIDVLHEMHWINNGQSFLYISDRNGWKQIFIVNIDDQNQNKDPLALTPIEVDVESIQGVNQVSGYVYYIASPDDPIRRYLYRAKLDGSETSRVTPESGDYLGTNAYTISGDGNYAIHSFSSANRPPSYCIVDLPLHQVQSVLASNSRLLDQCLSLNIPSVEFFKVDVGVDSTSGANGVLDGYCIYPPSLYQALQSGTTVSNQSYPVIFYVYGEPAAQVARDQWLGKMGLWHRYLAEKGAVVICIDNRGVPAPRGKKFRKCIYRQIGILASRDQAAAVEIILSSRPYLDPKRVAIWGWSGGGSMSLNLLFRSPHIYQTAVSIAPVPDMRYYDTIYQERYMGLPSENKEGYSLGSPITFAHQMKSQQNLLLIHGTGDDNCHIATTEILINELIRLNKPFQMLSYPNRSHSISEGHNTTRHLFEQMTRFLSKNGHLNEPIEE